MIVFLAPIFSDEILNRYPLTSPATPLWSRYFAKHLSKYDEISCFYYVSSPMFPKDSLFVKSHSYSNPVPTKMVSYIGLPYLRNLLRKRNMLKEIDKLVSKNKIDYIITINTSSINVSIANYLQKKGVKWVSIYADADTDKQLTTNANFHVYFSYDAFIRSNYLNKINFEGAVYRSVPESYIENCNKIFLYTGVIRKENGVDLMIDAFKVLQDKDAILKICGIGNYPGFIEKIKTDSRIKFYGLVDKKELEFLYEEATCFINPRLSSYEENNNNFPSKLLDYLSYAKPIITTHTKGINPIYLNNMYVVENEDIPSFAGAMNRMLSMSNMQKKELYEKIKLFANGLYSWNKRIDELWSWLLMNNKSN